MFVLWDQLALEAQPWAPAVRAVLQRLGSDGVSISVFVVLRALQQDQRQRGVPAGDHDQRGIRAAGSPMNWTGVEGSTEHRTVGPHRAWCYQDGEWCYPPNDQWSVDDKGWME
jgi:hypothetical protein